MKWLKTIVFFALFLSICIFLGNNTAEAITSSECNQPDPSSEKKLYINVTCSSAYSLENQPGSKRSIDQSVPVLSIPVDMRKWTN